VTLQLVVDAGNTQVKWAWWQADECISPLHHKAWPVGLSPLQAQAFWQEQMLASRPPWGVVGRVVVGETVAEGFVALTQALTALALAEPCPLHTVRRGEVSPLCVSRYAAGALGADRLANTVAVGRIFEAKPALQAVLVVDWGTFCKVDVVTKSQTPKGETLPCFEGGWLLPLTPQAKALCQQLLTPSTQPSPSESSPFIPSPSGIGQGEGHPPQSTVEALRQGQNLSFATALTLAESWLTEQGLGEWVGVATGHGLGLTHNHVSPLGDTWQVLPLLTLQGLARLG
jgi:pantothenate kinase type III